jgi:hypothetical protein
MKFSLVAILFISGYCTGQRWQAEVMVGVAGYRGDLTQHAITFKNLGPAVNLNLKYAFDNLIILRGGIGVGKLSADDKNNKDKSLRTRNLNFESDVFEGSLCVEFNLLDPEFYYNYPYVFTGVGIFHFNPYTFDNENNKTYLQPLGTEGQGLPEYPDLKMYKLTQFCLPIGAGWKMQLNKKWDVALEMGYRFLTTDFLDDVSTTYADPQILLLRRGAKAVQLAYRREAVPLLSNKKITRGNPEVKDGYLFSGIKLLIHLGEEQ